MPPLSSSLRVHRSSVPGFFYAEGYPRTKPANVDNPNNIPEAHLNYYGPLQMCVKAGFKIHRQFDEFASVRKKL